MNHMPALPKSISTACLSGSLAEKLEAAATIGFDGVSLCESDLAVFDGTLTDVRDIADGLGLSIACLRPLRDFEGMSHGQRMNAINRAGRKLDRMLALGADLLLVESNAHPEAVADRQAAAEDLATLADRAARHGLRVGYQALPRGRFVRTWNDAWRLVQAVNHPALGLALNSAHVLATDPDLAALRGLGAMRLFHVDLADMCRHRPGSGKGPGNGTVLPGLGDLPVARFLRAVLATGYEGLLCIDATNHGGPAGPPRAMARDAHRSLVVTEAEAGRTRVPDPPTYDGVAYIELAVDMAAGTRCQDHLVATGWSYAGQHPSMALRLFRRGRTHVILNAEPDTAAAELFALRGVSVAAVGLRVDDVARALARATAVLCPGLSLRVLGLARPVQALRAPDGVLVCLLQTDEADAIVREMALPLPSASSGAADPIVRAHDVCGREWRKARVRGAGAVRMAAADGDRPHCAQPVPGMFVMTLVVPPGVLDSTTLFWRSVLGFQLVANPMAGPTTRPMTGSMAGPVTEAGFCADDTSSRVCSLVSRDGTIRLDLRTSSCPAIDEANPPLPEFDRA